MSSSEASDQRGRGNAGAGLFEPLCPVDEEEKPVDPEWRPLLRDLGVDEFVGAENQDVRGSREGQSEADEGEAPSEESTREFAEGYELGRRETEADLQTVAESLVKSIEGIEIFRLQLRQRYERVLLELALEVARKILHAELKSRPDKWLQMISEGLREAVDREEVRIRVPTALAAFLTERLPEMRARLDEVKELVIVDDPTLQEGACVIETRFGELDLGIDSQVDQVERELSRVG